MTEYTDLELNSYLAILEFDLNDLTPHNGGYLVLDRTGNINFNGMPMRAYNPIEDWQILGPLMVKYEVEIHYDYNNCVRYVNGFEVGQCLIESKAGISRAIVECILKSKNII